MSDAKPVLWVSLTDAGRASAPSMESMEAVQSAVENAVGDDYHVVVADDRTRLASAGDLAELRDTIANTLPSELDADDQQDRYEAMGGLTPEDVQDGTGLGVQTGGGEE